MESFLLSPRGIYRILFQLLDLRYAVCICKCEDPLLNGVPLWQQGGESTNDGEDHMRALEELQASAGVNEDENTNLKQCSNVVSVHTNSHVEI